MGNLLLFTALGLLVFVVTGGFFYGLYVLLNPTRTAQDRLRDLGGRGGGVEEAEAFDIINVDDGNTSGGVASRLGKLAAPSSEEEKSKQRQMLLQAGFKNRHALEIFNSIRVTLALSLPLLTLPFAVASGFTPVVALFVLLAAAFGYYAPSAWLTNITVKRKRRLLAAFPDSLDLLVSCVEAGLGLDAAFRRVAIEMETAAPELAREFQIVTHEISAGVPRVEALRHLEVRTGLDEIRSLVNMLAQAERFGTSIAKGLRVHSRMTRQKRMSRAEEEAAKVSPKLTVVMILFLLPVLGVVLVGPAAIKVYEVMANR
ncbi:MAG: type II secretion system F family protein [Myxococcales bacterium]|nr:type II secretion system F family protein [Myxococcales bacterium]